MIIECCDGCLQQATKYTLVAGQWLCEKCVKEGTPLQKLNRRER